MTYTVKIEFTGALPTVSGTFFNYAVPALNELMQLGEKAAKEDYLHKKLSSPKLPSMIISSFGYKIEGVTQSSVHGVVFAGGSNSLAPYAVYVDEGHSYRGKNSGRFPGHQFMKTGAEAVAKNAEQVITKHMKAVL